VASDKLTELVNQLTPKEQTAVREFIEFLKSRRHHGAFLSAVDEFMEKHPDLLRRLAQ